MDIEKQINYWLTSSSMDWQTAKLMEELNQFQLDTRYPDEKFTLYNKATKEFTTERISKVSELRQWLLNQLSK